MESSFLDHQTQREKVVVGIPLFELPNGPSEAGCFQNSWRGVSWLVLRRCQEELFETSAPSLC